MHHKFLVRITNGQPTHVLLGSYNFTRRSNNNIGESVMVLADRETARKFANEAQRAWDATRPIRVQHVRQ
jgi:phosphatidylserine/phosphatidylglycerophosphate/cardiolipin synthase-like enzyme